MPQRGLEELRTTAPHARLCPNTCPFVSRPLSSLTIYVSIFCTPTEFISKALLVYIKEKVCSELTCLGFKMSTQKYVTQSISARSKVTAAYQSYVIHKIVQIEVGRGSHKRLPGRKHAGYRAASRLICVYNFGTTVKHSKDRLEGCETHQDKFFKKPRITSKQ